MKEITLVVAHARNRVIGKDNKLLWNLPSDMKHFKELTTGGTVLMGRKTYESLPPKFRPLPDRTNIVASLCVDFIEKTSNAGIFIAAGVEGFFEDFLKGNLKFSFGDEVFVIGGEQIYKAALPFATKIIATQIHSDFEGDTYFPEITEQDWEIVSRVSNPEENGLQSEVVTYHRRR